MKTKLFFPAILALSMALHVFLGWGATSKLAPTYDEPVHLTSGLVAWKTGNYAFNGFGHPPAAEMAAAFPLLFTPTMIPVQDPYWMTQQWKATAQYRFADHLLYRNRITASAMLAMARRAQLFLSSLLVLAIALAVALEAGAWAGAIAALLASCSTTLLAHGTLVTNDLLFAAMYFCFFAFLPLRREKWGAVLLGVFLGLCAASKFSAAGLVFAGGALAAWKLTLRRSTEKISWLNVAATAVTCLLTMAAVYRFTEFGQYKDGLQHFFELAQAGRSSFFLGHYSTTGWLGYFPAVFLMKTEIPLLLVWLAAVGFAAWGKFRVGARWLIPPAVFFAICITAKVQIGHRYLLPIYPFLIGVAGIFLARLPLKIRVPSVVLACASMAVTAFGVRPHFLSYFNEAAGGPDLGYRYFTDSNVDWGQGLSFVPAVLSSEDLRRGIYLCYFGVADPHDYGLKYLDVGSDPIAGHADDTSDSTLAPTSLVISATNLQGTYYANHGLFSWLSAYQPKSQIAHSLFLYDFSQHPEALERLKALRTPFHGA